MQLGLFYTSRAQVGSFHFNVTAHTIVVRNVPTLIMGLYFTKTCGMFIQAAVNCS